MRIEKYPSLNGLRAVSILLVIMHHLMLRKHVLKDLTGIEWLEPLIKLLQDGHFGVNIFFVVSGFLITSLLLKEEETHNKISIKNFYVRRAFRIFPAYFILLFVYFLLQALGYITLVNESWLTSITYTKYFNWRLDWETAHFWSLSIEEHFYIFWPLVFVFAKKIRTGFLFFLFFAVPLIRTYVHFYPVGWVNELTIFLRIDAIVLGCICAFYKEQIIKKVSPYWNIIFYCSIIILLLLPYLPILIENMSLSFIFIPLGVTHGTIGNIIIAFIMFYSVFGPKKNWYKFLNLRVVNYIGVLSYSIYLWQQLFVNETEYWINQFPQNILLMICVAICSYHIIEKPFLKLKEKFSVK